MSINRISTQALRILDENRHVEIHSAFTGAVNLRAGERLITCSADVISAPHGIEVSSADLAELQRLHRTLPDGVLHWDPLERRMSNRTATMVITSTPHTTIFDPALPSIRRDPMSRAVTNLIAHLAGVRALTGFGDQWPALTTDPHLELAVDALIDDQVDGRNLDDTVLYLLGRGPGLTPSGDDVLVGMIAALWFVGEIDSASLAPLRHVLVDAASQLTTDISVEYLHYACQGMVVGALHDLLLALERSDGPATANAVNQLRRYGHTSGMDCLLGVLTGLRHLGFVHRSGPHPRRQLSRGRRPDASRELASP